MKFNINEKVRVKLTDKGRRMLREDHDELFKNYPPGSAPYTPPKEDADGWSEWQMWCLMQSLGPHVALGCDPPFETTIEIPEVTDGR